MSKEQDVIQAAYEEALKQRFAIFLDNLIIGDPDEATTKFKRALADARDARDRALKLI